MFNYSGVTDSIFQVKSKSLSNLPYFFLNDVLSFRYDFELLIPVEYLPLDGWSTSIAKNEW